MYTVTKINETTCQVFSNGCFSGTLEVVDGNNGLFTSTYAPFPTAVKLDRSASKSIYGDIVKAMIGIGMNIPAEETAPFEPTSTTKIEPLPPKNNVGITLNSMEDAMASLVK